MKPNSLLTAFAAFAAASAPEAVCLTWKVPRAVLKARFVRDAVVLVREPMVRLGDSTPSTE